MLKEPKENLPVYFVATLSNDEVLYESGELDSWKKLLSYCNENNLTMKKFKIHSSDTIISMDKANAECFFSVYDVKSNLNSGDSTMKRGYGVVCNHPNGKRSYIEWFDHDSKKRIYAEVLRENQIPKFYEADIGIRKCK